MTGPYIVSRPGLRGGEPCIAGTRIPAAIIANLVNDGVRPRDIKRLYPGVTADAARAAVAYVEIGSRRRCQSRSKFGDCGLPQRHEGDHSVPIGPGGPDSDGDLWFDYTRRSQELIGYTIRSRDGLTFVRYA